MKQKLSVSIGIPAYNEEDNILQLIDALVKQTQKKIKTTEIMVYCDGSTDKTPQLVKSLKNPIIKLKVGNTRVGQQERQNQLIQDYLGDVLVIMEADILPYNHETIENLVKPFIGDESGKTGMVVGKPEIIKPSGFFEKILFYGYQMKYEIFSTWKGGINIYSCGGHSMKALSRRFTNKLQWPKDVPEDAYTYLRLISLGMRMQRKNSARAYMRNVTNPQDRIKQVKKFVSGKRILAEHFPKGLLEKEYQLPKLLVLKCLILALAKNPLWITLYLAELILNRLFTRGNARFNPLYSPYRSSKKLTIHP